MYGGVKKSVYLFLSSILGVLLFLILHRLSVFIYLLLVSYGIVGGGPSWSYMQFLAFDYATLLISLLFGSWYGIWLGNFWYEQVYEKGEWRGMLAHMRSRYLPQVRGKYNWEQKIESVKHRLEEDLSAVEELTEEFPAAVLAPQPVKRTLAKKKVVRKAKTLKTTPKAL